jgi:hypothetical protein
MSDDHGSVKSTASGVSGGGADGNGSDSDDDDDDGNDDKNQSSSSCCCADAWFFDHWCCNCCCCALPITTCPLLWPVVGCSRRRRWARSLMKFRLTAVRLPGFGAWNAILHALTMLFDALFVLFVWQVWVQLLFMSAMCCVIR